MRRLWHGNTDDPIGEFPCLVPIQKDMQEVYRLFNNENDVKFCLENLCRRISLTSIDAFQKSLLDLEIHYDFDSKVITPEKQLSSLEFLGYVAARRPIFDLAFKSTNHGSSTHRIQFMMIAIWREAYRDKINSKSCDIYKAMSNALKTGAMADESGNYNFEDVAWNHYFDVDPAAIWINNACRPDYFCGVFIHDQFPQLAQVAQ